MAAKPQAEKTKTKRRVRDPETFRERAVKASEQGDKPKRNQRVRTFGSKVLSPVVTPAATSTKALYGKKPLKPVRIALRLIGKVLLPVYIRNSWRELRQVTWLSWRKSLKLTSAVLMFAIVFGIVIALVDYGLDKVFKDILLK